MCTFSVFWWKKKISKYHYVWRKAETHHWESPAPMIVVARGACRHLCQGDWARIAALQNQPPRTLE